MRWLMAAGGTGGTVFPAIVVAKAAQAARPGTDILFVGTRRGLEGVLVPQAGFPIEFIQVRGLKRIGVCARLASLAQIPRAFWQSWRILRRFAPHLVFGSGGYASGPVLLLAALGGRKTAIVEPNAVPGFSNRLLGRFVDRVFLAFEEALSRMPGKKCVVTGNPIRQEILQVTAPTFVGERRTVFVYGGSQGAARLNRAVADALQSLQALRGRLFFLHQTGERDLEFVRHAYRAAGFEAEVRAFFGDMAGALAKADLVVARAGSSVLEVAACGRPSVLVPFPFAADRHQEANARVLERSGGAVLLKDGACTGETLGRLLSELLGDPARLKRMSEGALRLRRAGAAQRIVAEMEAMVGA